MREILFRGKDDTSGEWITGFLVSEKHIGNWVECEPIIPKTVGQYTGLTDNIGRKIFEGDIVSIGGHIDTVNGLYRVIYDTANHCWALERSAEHHHHYFTFSDLNGFADTSSVVGNIHDNPELLEE